MPKWTPEDNLAADFETNYIIFNPNKLFKLTENSVSIKKNNVKVGTINFNSDGSFSVGN